MNVDESDYCLFTKEMRKYGGFLGRILKQQHVGVCVRACQCVCCTFHTLRVYSHLWFIRRELLRELFDKQECIPVGCVPPAVVAVCWGVWGVSASVLAGIHPPRCGSGDPSARPLNLPPGCGPGDLQGMLGYYPSPCGQNSWHMLLKILPCPNFVADGNNELYCSKWAHSHLLSSAIWSTSAWTEKFNIGLGTNFSQSHELKRSHNTPNKL